MKTKKHRDRIDIIFDNCDKYRKEVQPIEAVWEYRYFDNKEAMSHMFAGCIIEYHMVGSSVCGDTERGWSEPGLPFTEFKTVQSDTEIEFYGKILGDAEHAKMYSQYEILGVFKQNDETGDIIKIWGKPIPHDNYQIIIKKS